MFDLISIGNISIDLYFKGDSLTLSDTRFELAIGGKYFTDHFFEGVGGGGANVAVGAAKNGLDSAVFGLIGQNPFKNIILNKLHDQGIRTFLCPVVQNYFCVSSIFLTEKGEKTIVNYTTPHKHLFKNESIYRLSQARMVYFGHLANLPFAEKLSAISKIKQKKVEIIINLAVDDCRMAKSKLSPLLQRADILIVNGHEFADLVKAPYKDIRFKENVIAWYIPDLSGKLVVVTEGEKGSYAYLNGKIFHQSAIKIEAIVDTTGAGDAYTSAFISEYLKSRDVKKSMEKAAHYSAKNLLKIGAN